MTLGSIKSRRTIDKVKRKVAILLVFVMVLSMLPPITGIMDTQAYAADPTWVPGPREAFVTSSEDLRSALLSTAYDKIYLGADITFTGAMPVLAGGTARSSLTIDGTNPRTDIKHNLTTNVSFRLGTSANKVSNIKFQNIRLNQTSGSTGFVSCANNNSAALGTTISFENASITVYRTVLPPGNNGTNNCNVNFKDCNITSTNNGVGATRMICGRYIEFDGASTIDSYSGASQGMFGVANALSGSAGSTFTVKKGASLIVVVYASASQTPVFSNMLNLEIMIEENALFFVVAGNLGYSYAANATSNSFTVDRNAICVMNLRGNRGRLRSRYLTVNEGAVLHLLASGSSAAAGRMAVDAQNLLLNSPFSVVFATTNTTNNSLIRPLTELEARGLKSIRYFTRGENTFLGYETTFIGDRRNDYRNWWFQQNGTFDIFKAAPWGNQSALSISTNYDPSKNTMPGATPNFVNTNFATTPIHCIQFDGGSRAPIVDTVYVGSRTVMGLGQPGAEISVTWPTITSDGTPIETMEPVSKTIVEPAGPYAPLGIWVVTVPEDIFLNISSIDLETQVKVTQRETHIGLDRGESYPVYAPVIGTAMKIIGNNGRNIYYDLGTVPDKAEILFFGSGTNMKLEEGKGRYILTNSLAALASPGNADVFEAVWAATPTALKGYINPNEGTYWREELCNIPANCSVWAMADVYMGSSEETTRVHDVINYSNLFIRREIKLRLVDDTSATQVEISPYTTIPGNYGIPYTLSGTVLTGTNVRYNQVNLALNPYMSDYWTAKTKTGLQAPIPITLDANFPVAYLDMSDDPTGSTYTLFMKRVEELWDQVPMAYVDREGKPIPDSGDEPLFIWVPLDILEEEEDDEDEEGDSDPVADITSSNFLLRGGRFIPQKHHPFTPVGYYVNINAIDVREEPPGDPAFLYPCDDFSKDFDPQITDITMVPKEKIYIVYDEGITSVKETHKFIEDIDGEPIYPERNSIAKIETGKPPIVYTAPKVAGYVPIGWEIGNLTDSYSGEFQYDPDDPEHNVTMDQNGHVFVELTPEMIAGGFDPSAPEELEILWIYARDANNNGIPDDEEVRINLYWYGMYPDSPYPAHLDNTTISSRFGYEITVANDGLDGNEDHKIEIDSGRAAGVWLFDSSLPDNEAVVTITPPDATPQTIEFLYGPRDVYPGYVMVTVIGKSGDTELYRHKTQYLENTGSVRVYGFEVKGYSLKTASPVALNVQDKDLEVIFDYDSLATTVKIRMVDEDDKDLLPPITAAAEAGAPFTYNAPHVPGYSLIYPAESTIGYVASVAGDSTSEIKFTYKPITSKLTIICKEDNDKGPIIRVVEIPEASGVTGFHDYTAPNLTADFFTVKPGSEEITIYWDGANAASGEAYYTKELVNITINKFDVTNSPIRDPIPPSDLLSGQRRGEAVTVNAPNISGMVLVSPVSKTVIASPGRTVEFDYRNIGDDEVAVKALDKETGNTLLSYIVSGIPDERIYADAPTLPGWSLDGLEYRKSAVIGTNKEIVFYYVKSIVKVTVEAIHITSNRVIQSTDYEVPRFSDYTAFSPNIKGYVLEGDGVQFFTDLNDDIKATFYYRTITEVYDDFYVPITIRGINPIVGSLYSYTKRIAQDQLPYTLIDGVDVFAMKGYTLDPDQNHLVSEDVKPGDVFEFMYTSTAGTVMITMIDQDSGVKIKESYPVEAEVDKPFTYHAPYISGYRVVGDNPITIDSVLPAGASEITFEYVKINSKVVIHYKEIDDDGKVIRTIRTIEIEDPEVDEETEVSTPNLDAPDYYTAQQKSVSYLFNGEDSVEVDAYYKKNLVDVTVRMIDFFTSAKIDEQIITGNRQGEAAEIRAPHLTGWILADEDTKTIIPLEGSVVEFKYREQEKHEVQVKAIVKDTGEELQKYTLSGREGDPVTVWAPIMLGWKLVDETDNHKEVVIGTDYDAIFYYEKNVATITVHAIHLTDTEEIVLDPEITYEVPKGGGITIYAPHIDGYVVSGKDKDILSSVAFDGDIYFFYLTVAEKEALSNITVTIRGVNSKATAAPALYSYQKRLSTSELPYTLIDGADVFTMSGYTLDAGQDHLVPADAKTGDIFEFKYTSTAGTVTISMKDQDTGAAIKTSFLVEAEVGKPFSYHAPYITGYRVVGDNTIAIDPVLPNGESEIVFEYVEVISKVIINYKEIDNEGKVVRTIRTIEIEKPEIDEETEVITPNLDTPDYYTAQQTTVSYIYNGFDPVEVDAYYKKNLVDVTVEMIDFFDPSKNIGFHIEEGKRQGEATEIKAPHVSGWILADEDTKTIIANEGIVVTFKYREQEKYEVQVKAIVKDTGEELQKYTLSGREGDPLTVWAPFILGWKLVESNNYQEVVLGEDFDAFFYYEKNVATITVRAFHLSALKDIPLDPPITYEVPIGGGATILAPHIDGYVIEGKDREILLPPVLDDDDVIFNYVTVAEKDAMSNVSITIAGKNRLTGAILYSYSKRIAKNDMPYELEKDVDLFAVPGFTLDEDQDFVVKDDGVKTYYFDYTSTEGYVRVKMIEEDTDRELDSFNAPAVVGEAFTCKAPYLPGFRLVSEKGEVNIDPVLPDGKSEAIFKYTRINSKITVEYREDTPAGVLIRTDEITDETEGENLPFNPPLTLPGYYSLIKPTYDTVYYDYNGSDSVTVIACYAKNLVSVTVKKVKLNDSTDIEEPHEVGGLRQGEAATITAPRLDDWVLVGANTQTVIAETGDEVVTFIYRTQEAGEVQVKAIDKDTDKLLQSYALPGTLGDEVFVIAPIILGWKLADPTSSPKLVEIGEDKEVIFEYEKDVVIVTINTEHWESHAPLQEPIEIEVAKGGEATIYAPHIPGHIIVGTDKYTWPSLGGDVSVTFLYKKVSELVTITIIGQSGSTMLYRYEKMVPVDSGNTEIHAFDVKGYSLDGDSPAIVDVKDKNETVVFEYISLTTTVTIRMVDDNDPTKDVAAPFVVAAEAGSPFTYNAPDVAGYYLTSESTIGVLDPVVAGDTNVITFKYAKITSLLTIICKEENAAGRVIRVVEIPTAGLGAGTYTYPAPVLTNDFYTPKAGSEEVTITWDGITAASVEAYYSKNMVNITINLLDVTDPEEPELIRSESLSARKGEAVTVGAPDVSLMLLVGPAAKTVIALDDTVVEFGYRELNDDEVAVKAIYKDSADKAIILQSYVLSGAINETIYADAPTILGWVLKNPAESRKSAQIGRDKEIIFEYVKNIVEVTIKAVHKTTKDTIQPDMIVEVPKGSSYTAYAPHIAGYVIEGASTKSFIGIAGNAEVTFEYLKVEEVAPGYVTITVIGQSGSTMLYRYEKTLPAKSGNTEIQAFDVKGYALKGESKITVDVQEKNETVVFDYESLTTTVTIRMVDDKDPAKNVAAPFVVAAEAGSPFTYNAPDVAGYYLTSESTIGVLDPVVAGDTNVITFKYAKITSLLTIICKEENAAGRVIRVVEIPTAGLGAGTYTYPAPVLTNDFYTPKAGSEEVTITWDGITAASVEAYYSKNMVNITINLLDVTDPEEPELIRSESLSARKGEAVTVGAPDVSLMLLVGPAAKTVIALDDTVVEFGYRELNDDEVAVKAIYKDSADKAIILQSYVLSGAINETIYADAPTILGWVLKNPAESRKSALVGRDKEIIFEYVKNIVEVTIKAVHKTTGYPIQPQIVTEVPKGGSYTAYAPHISGFVIDGISTKSFIGLSGNAEVTFEYLKVGEIALPYLVTIEVIGKSGSTELYRYEKIAPVNSGITEIHAFNVRGYRLAESATTPVEVNVIESRETVIFDYESLATTVTIKMVDAAGNNVAMPFNVAAQAGSPFTYNAPNVAGYKLTSASSIGVLEEVASGGTSTITFVYAKITSKVTIVYKEDDENGRVIRVIEIVDPARDVETIVLTPDLDDEYYTANQDSVTYTFNGSDAVEVEAYYTKILIPVAIKLFDVTNTLAPELMDTASLAGQRKGEVVTVGAPDVEDMILVGSATQTIIADGVKTADFNYRNVKEDEVAVKAVDEATNVILQSYVMTGAVGYTVYASAPSILGWKLVDESAGTKSAVIGTNKEIRFDYEKDVVEVTINLIHKTNGNLLMPPKVIEVPTGGDYAAYAPHIAGYVINGDSTREFTSLAKNEEVTFEYLKVGEIALPYLAKIEVIGKSGATELYRYDKLLPVDSGITEIHAFNVRGYRLVDPDSTPAQVDVKDNNETVIFDYESLATTVTIKMVDAAGNNVAMPFNVAAEAGSPFTYNAPNVASYKLTSTSSIGVLEEVASGGTSTITFVYAKITSKVTIVYKEDDENGRVIRVIEITDPNDEGVETEVATPNLEEEFYTANQDSVFYTFDGSDAVEVEAYYTKILIPVEIKLFDLTNPLAAELMDTITLTGQRKGEVVTIGAPDVEDMILVSSATQTIIADGVKTADFNYRNVKEDEVAVKAVDEATNVILQSYVMTGAVGYTVYASAPSILGWKLVDESASTKSAVIGTNKEIRFDYEKDVVEVTINLVHKTDGSLLMPPTVVEVPSGGDYTAYAPHITGYVIDGVSTKSFFNLSDNDSATFTYLTLHEATHNYVIVTVIGKSGATQLYYYDMMLPKGSGDKDIHALEIKGYILSDPDSSPVTIDIQDANETVIFEYDSLATAVTIRMVDEEGIDLTGSPITETAEIGAPFTYNAPDVEGYYLTSESTIGVLDPVVAGGPNLITFEYAEITSKLIIVCQEDDSDGRVIRVVQVDEDDCVTGENEILVPDLSNDYFTPLADTITFEWDGISSLILPAYYTKNLVKITVNMFNVTDPDNHELIGTKEVSGLRQGEAVTVGAPDVEDMILVGPAAKTVIANPGVTVSFNYREIADDEVAVKAVAEDNTILLSYIIKGTIGETVSADAPVIPGWTLKDTETTKSAVVGTNKEIRFNYARTVVETVRVTINTLLANGTPVRPATVEEVPKGVSYTAYAPHIAGYVLADGAKEKTEFTSLEMNSDVITTFVYKTESQPTTTVKVNLLNAANGSSIGDAIFVENLIVGQNFNFLTYDPLKHLRESFVVGTTRWTRVTDSRQNLSISSLLPMGSAGTANEINAYYNASSIGGTSNPGGSGNTTPASATLIVRAKDVKSGETIYEQSLPAYVGTKYTVKAPSVEGYTLDASSAASQDVTVNSKEQVITFNYNYTGSSTMGHYNLKETLETDRHISYISGYPNGTVRPDGSITRAEAAMIFWRLLRTTDKNSTVGTRFRDVKDGQWYSQAISYLARMGILLGYPDGTFRPNQRITRAEFTTIAARFDSLVTDVTNPFSDVKAGHWASQYILSAYSKGWITGYADGTFKPAATINRGEAVAIVNRMLSRVLTIDEVPAEFHSRYSDLSTTHWAFSDIIEASVEHEHEYKEDGTEVWTKW